MISSIDEALGELSFAGTELVNGNSNHGPMACEALFALGREDAVSSWIDGYRSRLTRRASPSAAIPHDEWREHLGVRERLGDWVQLMEDELSEAPWQAVVQRWVPRLAPGLIAAATHGLIRTSHGVRSLSQGETPLRKLELAQGLGYWAAAYRTLPGAPTGGNGGHYPKSALNHVGLLNGPDFDRSGSIAEQLKGMDEHPEFAPVIDLADTGGDADRFISDLTETFAGIYLASNRNLVAFVHTVTAPSAFRMLSPYLRDDDRRLCLRYIWQACAAVYCWYSTVAASSLRSVEAPVEDREEIIDRAVAAGGAHSIKFTEACLREYNLNASAVYLTAALDVSQRIGPV